MEDVALNWDLIVLSAADEDQKKCFEKLLALKYANSEKPKLETFRVVADLPGNPLGSGGSALQVLQDLHKEFSDGLYDLKILLIPAGGFSKRLPSLSCTGKLFLPLPIPSEASDDVTLLDVKLKQTAPFLPFFKNGGFLLTASDDIETYSTEGLNQVVFTDDDGVTAIAHPSSIAIGKTHGVYVLERGNSKEKIWVSTAKEVLQKPSYEVMKSRNAIFKDPNEEDEKVYTDSFFWCGKNVVKQLVKFSSTEDMFKFETCMFGDFLTAMGSNARKHHSEAFQNVDASANPLLKIKSKFFEEFQSTRLNVLVLEDSEFFHLGTMQEYLENLQPSSRLFAFLGMQTRVRCHYNNKSPNGVVINSLISSEEVEIKGHSIIEFCRINCPLVVNENVILSNCEISNLPKMASVPPSWLFHTAAVANGFVTMAVHVEDDVKNSVSADQVLSLPYGSITLKSLLPEDYKTENKEQVSLWNIPLFTVERSMAESFAVTYKMIVNFLKDEKADFGSAKRLSFKEVCKSKRIDGFVDYRRGLLHEISGFC